MTSSQVTGFLRSTNQYYVRGRKRTRKFALNIVYIQLKSAQFAEPYGSLHLRYSFIYNKATTSVLMTLSLQTGVSNFRSNLLLSFLSIVRILSSEAISFQIPLYALFQQFSFVFCSTKKNGIFLDKTIKACSCSQQNHVLS